MEDLRKEIGRSLTDEERVDVVRRNGHPVVVAGQYRGHERLIGPRVFPVYLKTLIAGFGITILVTLVLSLFPVFTAGRRPALRDILASVAVHGLMVFAGTTLVFAADERWQLRRRSDALASRERADAQAIQRALLPAVLPAFIGCELAVRWQPASAFGGDCYDAIRLSDTMLALSIADVCGKGLPAALVMSSLQASVRAFASVDPTPRSVVSQLNQALCRNVDLRRFVTFFYGVYDSNTRRLTYTNAGHNPPAIVRADGSVLRLAGGGMVVGMVDAATYEQEEVALDPGDRLVLFTDGITEAESSEGLDFGDDRLLETVVRSRSLNPDRILRCLFDEVTRFAGRHLRDDATAIAVAIR
jgi:sigma-B regulation protein RsbU (phosphoserine phosphatase)